MKYAILAAAFALTATAASAFEIGDTGLLVNNSIVAEYDTSTEVLATTYTPELRYIALEGVSIYMNTEFDLQDPAFNGVTVGAEYAPGAGELDLITYVKATSDADLQFNGVIVGAELNF